MEIKNNNCIIRKYGIVRTQTNYLNVIGYFVLETEYLLELGKLVYFLIIVFSYLLL